MTDPLLVALERIVHRKRHLPLYPQSKFVLKEKSRNATLSTLNLDCRGCNEVFGFSLDVRTGNGQAIPLCEHLSKDGGGHWNKVCDAILVWRSGETLRVLVCDLKSSAPHGSDWKSQLWSSACFVQYILEIARRFLHESPPASVIFHAVAFHGASLGTGARKRRTGLVLGTGYPSTDLDTPGRIPVSDGGYIPLNALCR
ncbi:MAG TPA: hypothetical protein VHB20_09030 [Verrucomicrobiae bacterium]|jgi:hypothetical protein|nr:hypothetical protein [Verrucomicrobiae bacterium]